MVIHVTYMNPTFMRWAPYKDIHIIKTFSKQVAKLKGTLPKMSLHKSHLSITMNEHNNYRKLSSIPHCYCPSILNRLVFCS